MAKTKPSEQPKAIIKTPVMYVGPSFAKYGLVQNTVYTDVPQMAKPLFELVPLANLLLIKVEDYAAAEEGIRTQKGQVWKAYQAVLDKKGE